VSPRGDGADGRVARRPFCSRRPGGGGPGGDGTAACRCVGVALGPDVSRRHVPVAVGDGRVCQGDGRVERLLLRRVADLNVDGHIRLRVDVDKRNGPSRVRRRMTKRCGICTGRSSGQTSRLPPRRRRSVPWPAESAPPPCRPLARRRARPPHFPPLRRQRSSTSSRRSRRRSRPPSRARWPARCRGKGTGVSSRTCSRLASERLLSLRPLQQPLAPPRLCLPSRRGSRCAGSSHARPLGRLRHSPARRSLCRDTPESGARREYL